MSDFFQGYGVDYGAGVNQGAASVDVESYREAGRADLRHCRIRRDEHLRINGLP